MQKVSIVGKILTAQKVELKFVDDLSLSISVTGQIYNFITLVNLEIRGRGGAKIPLKDAPHLNI